MSFNHSKERRNRMFTEEMINDIVKGLQEIYKSNVLQIILYGSIARKEATEESDIDIAIIIKNSQTYDERERFISWNSEMDLKYNRVFSIIDIEKAVIDKWGGVLPFYKNIKKEGIVLWKAA